MTAIITKPCPHCAGQCACRRSNCPCRDVGECDACNGSGVIEQDNRAQDYVTALFKMLAQRRQYVIRARQQWERTGHFAGGYQPGVLKDQNLHWYRESKRDHARDLYRVAGEHTLIELDVAESFAKARAQAHSDILANPTRPLDLGKFAARVFGVAA